MAVMTITNAGLNLIRDGLSGANNPLITYVALGTGSTAPGVGQTQLVAESFRKTVTSFVNGASPGELIITMYLGPGDDVGDGIQEVGFFGGSTATSAPNTGIMLARGLYVHTKLATESIQFPLDIVI